MYRDYTQEEFQKLYKDLPRELQDALFSEETGNNIDKICRRYDIEDKFSDILNLVGQTLLGLLPIEEIEKVLIRDVGLSMSESKEISREITRFIFFPVKDGLTEVYGIGSQSEKVLEKEEAIPVTPQESDSYRESIED